MSLVAWYKLDGDPLDSSGNGHHGTNNGVTWVDGKIGQAGDFNGSSKYISASEVSDRLHGKSEASIALWCKKNSIQYGFLQLSGYANSNGNLYPYQTSTRVYLDVFRTNRLGPIEMHSSVLEWHHVVITQSPSGWRLYQNGELVHETTANDRVATDYLQFEIGRNSSSRYADALMDDVKVYNHALSTKEIKELAKAKVGHWFRNENYLDMSGYDHHADLFGATLTPDSAIGSGSYEFNGSNNYAIVTDNFVSNPDQLTIASWFKKTSTGDNYNCVVHKASSTAVGTSEYWLGTSAGNYVVATIGANTSGLGWESGETNVTCNMNEWYHAVASWDGSTVRVYVNGEFNKEYSLTTYSSINTDTRFGASSNGSNYQFGGVINDTRIYNTALSADDIKELYQSRANLDDQGNFSSSTINQTNFIPMILDYRSWVIGSTGSQTGFSQNGSTSENQIIEGVDPFDETRPIWLATPDATSGADGGWNSSRFPVDNTKTYRFSVWVKRNQTSNGRFYFGCRGYGSISGVLGRDNGNNYTNPYFYNDITTIPINEWILVVGHVWKEGSGTGSSNIDSGLYNMQGEKIINTHRDFVWRTETNESLHRSYLYYATDTTQRQEWCYPRVDIVDGTEPTIDELLSGHDSRNFDFISTIDVKKPLPLNLNQKGIANISNLSTVGIVDGIQAWYPLDGDTNDRSGNENHGVNNGATVVSGHDGQLAYEFSGSNSWIDLGDTLHLPNNHPLSLSGWVRYNAFSSRDMMLCRNDAVRNASPYTWLLGTINGSTMSAYDGGSWHSISYNFQTGQWYHLAFSFDGTTMRFYVNGKQIGTSAWSFSDSTTGRNTQIGGYTSTSDIDGKMQDIRFFDRALSQEEVAILYYLTGGSDAKMKMTKDTLYLKGELKEV